MKSKSFILALLAFLVLLPAAGAQDKIPAFRAQGYKGSVSFTSLGLYWNGVETSQGYMLSDRYYLGGGAGLLVGAVWDATLAARVFADAQAYWRPQKNTPFSRVRMGYLHYFYGETNMFQADFTFGWSWGLSSGGRGLTFDLGVSTVLPPGLLYAGIHQSGFSLGPILSLSYEF